MTTPTVYKSTDASAPVLTGQAGSLVALLDACLVNGYSGKSALGWAKAFSGTNGGVYRAPTGLRHYLQVTDNGATTNTFKEAQAWGFETMSAYNTGTGQFPTTAQMASGTFWNKSSTADATARPWTLVGDDKTFYLFIHSTGATFANVMGFGEIASVKSGDAYSTFIAGCQATNAAGNPAGSLSLPAVIGSATGVLGFYYARSYTQTGSSQNGYSIGPTNSTGLHGNAGITYPNAVDGGLYFAPIPCAEALTGGPIRGRLRGMFSPLHVAPLSEYDTFTSPTGLATGITLMAVASGSSGTTGQLLVDITGPW